MRIYLIGFMGSGKTSFGRRLARKLDYDFVDIDQEVESLAGQKVAGVFAERGEEGFRNLECEVLRRTAQSSGVVVATGGGTPCYHNNMDFMLEHGVTVYLKMSPLSLYRRLEMARKERPLLKGLKGEELLQLIENTLSQREGVYNRSHCIIKGETVRPRQVISLIFGH